MEKSIEFEIVETGQQEDQAVRAVVPEAKADDLKAATCSCVNHLCGCDD